MKNIFLCPSCKLPMIIKHQDTSRDGLKNNKYHRTIYWCSIDDVWLNLEIPQPSRLAGCVIYNQTNQLLLIHRHKNGKIQWEIPGGKVNQEESDKAAAKRELLEETGIEVVIDSKITEADFIEQNHKYHYVWFKAKFKTPQNQIKLESGFDNFKYFSSTELRKIYSQLSPGTKKFLDII